MPAPESFLESSARPVRVVVLAAGAGTRMKSATPKVLHPLCGRSMLSHVLAAVAPLVPERVTVVVGHGADQVVAATESPFPDGVMEFVHQAEPRGTGDAASVALAAWADDSSTADVLVLPGDTPLLTALTLRRLVDSHQRSSAAVTVLSAELADPAGYGRILRDGHARVVGVVEHRDATGAQREIREVNTSIYCFERAALTRAVAQLSPENDQGELYLTDALALLHDEGAVVEAVTVSDVNEVRGCNDREQLSGLEVIMRARINGALMRAGVTMVDPAHTYVDVDVAIASDVVLLPGTMLRGAVSIGEGSVIGPNTQLTDSTVGARAVLQFTVAHGVTLGDDVTAGPFAHLRPGTVLAGGVHIGSYVETKNVDVGEGAKIPHLSYVGDTAVGAGANIGAGTITANYDGKAKHRTVIGEGVRTGSNSVLVAPVEIGEGAYIGAGSVVTRNVPAWALAKGVPARIDEGWVRRQRG